MLGVNEMGKRKSDYIFAPEKQKSGKGGCLLTVLGMLLAVVLVGFAALGGYFFYAVTAYGTRWFSTPYNTRLQRAKSQVYAGSIYDRNAHLLVRTAEDGSREYPVSETAKAAICLLYTSPSPRD